MVGGLGVLVNFAVFNLCRAVTTLPVVRCSVISTSVAVLVNYLGFRYFAYRDRDKRRPAREFTLFVVFSIIGLAIENGVLYAATYRFGWDYRSPEQPVQGHRPGGRNRLPLLGVPHLGVQAARLQPPIRTLPAAKRFREVDRAWGATVGGRSHHVGFDRPNGGADMSVSPAGDRTYPLSTGSGVCRGAVLGAARHTQPVGRWLGRALCGLSAHVRQEGVQFLLLLRRRHRRVRVVDAERLEHLVHLGVDGGPAGLVQRLQRRLVGVPQVTQLLGGRVGPASAFPERASLSEVEARVFSAATLAGGNFFTAWPGAIWTAEVLSSSGAGPTCGWPWAQTSRPAVATASSPKRPARRAPCAGRRWCVRRGRPRGSRSRPSG